MRSRTTEPLRSLAIGFASGSWGESDTSHLVYNNYSVIGVIPTFYDRAFESIPEALERLVAGGVRGKLALAVDPKATAPV